MRIGKVTENVLKRSVFKLHKVKNDQESAAVGQIALFLHIGKNPKMRKERFYHLCVRSRYKALMPEDMLLWVQ